MTFTKTEFALGSLVVLVSGKLLMAERAKEQSFDTSHAALVQQLAALRADAEKLSRKATASAELSSNLTGELLRLRQEFNSLHPDAEELAELRAQNERLRARFAHVSEQAASTNTLSADDQYTLRHTYTSDAVNSIMEGIALYREEHGKDPTSFAQLTTSGALAATNFGGDLTLDDFEWLPPGVIAPFVHDPSEAKRLWVRNRVPIPKPGGDPVWVDGYLTTNGPGEIVGPGDYVAHPVAGKSSSASGP